MAKNTSKAPLKWQVWADNNGLSSNFIQQGIDIIQAVAADMINDEDGPIYSSAKIYSMLPDKTESGAVTSFSDAIPELPVKAYTLNIEAVQEGSGDPAPDNVRPISGWNKITLKQSGADTTDPVNTFEISLGDTIYGGTLDSDGNGEVTYILILFNSLNWVKVTNVESPYFYAPLLSPYKYIDAQNNFKCSQYKKVSVGSTGSSEGIFMTNTSQIRCRDLRYTDNTADEFKTATGDVQLIYELTTAIPFTVSNMPELKTLTGENNIWCDTGNTYITYKTYPGV